MPRRPCMVCRTTVSTPVKFLLQCSCGIGLHHTCIVPAIPKEMLLLMVKASTNGCHANSLDSWHCPGCKATENAKQTAPTMKKHGQPHPFKRLDLGSPARARLDGKMRNGMQALPIPAKPHSPVNKPSKDSKPAVKRVKQSRHPSAPLENEKETTRPWPARNPKPLSTNAPRQHSLQPKNRDSSPERVVTANADIRLMVQPSSSKMTPTDSNVILQAELSPNPPVEVGQVQPKAIIKPTQNTLPPVVPHIPPTKPFPTTAGVHETTAVLPSNKAELAPLPPLLDLRRLLKRKRPHMPKVFQPNLRVSPVDDNDEIGEKSPAKRRRLNYDCHPALREVELVVGSSSDSLRVKDMNRLIQVQVSMTPLREISSGPLPSDLVVHEQDKPPKDDDDMVQEDAQIQGARSDSESGSNIAIATAANEARLIEDSPASITDIEAATTHSEGRGSSHTDAPATFSKEASPTHARDNELVMADIMEPEALYSGLARSLVPPSVPLSVPPRTEQDETSDDSSLERSEVDQSLNGVVAENNSQDGSEPISNGDFGVGAMAPQETSLTDGLFSPPLSDDINDFNHQLLDKGVAYPEKRAESRQHELDPATPGISDFADQNQMCKDKVSIAAPSDHPENGSPEEGEKQKKKVLITQLDAIVQRLPQLQPRRSYKLPKVTLPVLATCFGPFKATSKRVGVLGFD